MKSRRRLSKLDKDVIRTAIEIIKTAKRRVKTAAELEQCVITMQQLEEMVRANPLSRERRCEIARLGGHARAKALTPEQLSEIGRKGRDASRGRNPMVTF